MSSSRSEYMEDERRKGDAEAKALEEEYRETHPNGSFPPVVIEKKDA